MPSVEKRLKVGKALVNSKLMRVRYKAMASGLPSILRVAH